MPKNDGTVRDLAASAREEPAPRTRQWWRGEVLVTLGLAVFALGYLVYATRYRALPLTDPGPGLVPTAFGAGLLGASVLGLLVLVLRHRGGAGEVAPEFEPEDPDMEAGWVGGWRPLSIVALLFVFSRLATDVGFMASAWVMFLVAAQILRPGQLIRSVVVASVVVGASYYVFVIWLAVNLPAGFIGF